MVLYPFMCIYPFVTLQLYLKKWCIVCALVLHQVHRARTPSCVYILLLNYNYNYNYNYIFGVLYALWYAARRWSTARARATEHRAARAHAATSTLRRNTQLPHILRFRQQLYSIIILWDQIKIILYCIILNILYYIKYIIIY